MFLPYIASYRHYSRYFIAFLLGLTISYSLYTPTAFAQNNAKLLQQANALYDALDYESAIPLYRDVLLEDNSQEAKIKLAECYRLTGNCSQAAYWYNLLINSLLDPVYQLNYGRVLQCLGKYELAKKHFLNYAQYDELGKTLAEGCSRVDEFTLKSDPYYIYLPPFNTVGVDISPVLFGKGLLYTSDQSTGNSRAFTDIYYTEPQPGNAYTPPKKVKGDINSLYNDGPASITANGQNLFFTRNAPQKSKNIEGIGKNTTVLAIYETTLNDKGDWTTPIPFQYNSNEYSITHPAISPDGKTLYFVSDMPGGYGGTDIYMSTRVDSLWSEPLNLGAIVNTSANERFPYMHNDGTLYFSSNGLPGLGGLDIYATRRLGGVWENPRNMATPINSSYDDFGLAMTPDKRQGYFTSNREGGMGKDDIYAFEVKGMTKDTPLATTSPSMPTVDTPLEEIIINTSIGMGAVYFQSGSSRLFPEAKQELDKLALFLQTTPEIALIEIGTHTDSRYDDVVSMEVTKKRAQNIANYLTSKNIPAEKLTLMPYGETRLLNHCENGIDCDNALHDINNRVEIKIKAINGEPTTPALLRLIPPPPAAIPASNSQSWEVEEPINEIEPTTPAVDTTPAYETTPENSYTPDTETTPTDAQVLPPTPKLTYKVYIGPFKNVDNDTYYTYAELNTPISLQYTEKGMVIALGPYDQLKEAEEYELIAKGTGDAKTRIVVFEGDKESTANLKKLKKLKQK